MIINPLASPYTADSVVPNKLICHSLIPRTKQQIVLAFNCSITNECGRLQLVPLFSSVVCNLEPKWIGNSFSYSLSSLSSCLALFECLILPHLFPQCPCVRWLLASPHYRKRIRSLKSIDNFFKVSKLLSDRASTQM